MAGRRAIGHAQPLEQLDQLVARQTLAQLGELRHGPEHRRQRVSVELLGVIDDRRATAMGRGEQAASLTRELGRRVLRAGQRVELAQRPAQALARLRGGVKASPAQVGLEPVGDLGTLKQARGAQIVEQILAPRPVGQQGAARKRQQPTSQRRVPERNATIDGGRDPVLLEHLVDRRRGGRRGAIDDRDLLARDPRPQQTEHFGGDELGLGALAAGLEQAHRAARIDATRRRLRLEQIALDVVKRGS